MTRDTLEVCAASVHLVFGYRNETFGIESLTDAVAEWLPRLVVVEAAGGLECMVACSLQAARLPVAVVQPHQARGFVDRPPSSEKGAQARLMAELARMLDDLVPGASVIEPLSDPDLHYVQALVQRRRQLAHALIAEYQSLARCHPSVRRGVEQTIACLSSQIDAIDRQCGRQVRTQRVGVARLLARTKRPARSMRPSCAER
ncbi:hypothetical protein C7H84_25670 [Burkholderia sp. Nafp2/4-1b]|uniref:hypothetical protein n=1 Tax=Burkholderia sp. Nafp2/4-1b TaxID=2116686 RepID=UPI000EF8546F|nr:hypothetical protein [Burkholderia sp. Nafp2/4-1b]RKU00491.1 hypothetical protein C7H84_25670 [Burkholderia sp. Nafp2/4-1b]